jgi:hypothetical protein
MTQATGSWRPTGLTGMPGLQVEATLKRWVTVVRSGALIELEVRPVELAA